MSEALPVQTVSPEVPEVDEPVCYGWRYVRYTQTDGTEAIEQVPLTLADLLYPEEDDFVVQEPVHTRDFIYCHSALETFYAGQDSVVVLGDCRVDWGVYGVRPLGPDIVVFFDVHQWQRRATFRRAAEGGNPVLVIEIVSPSTRVHDLGVKFDLYDRVGVQKYVLVDRGPQGRTPVRLLGYQRSPTGWQQLVPDAQDRLDLSPVHLRLGVEADRPWLYDAATGGRIPDRAELQQALTEAETRRREAEALVLAETRARAALEARLRELEEALRRQRGNGS